MSILAVLTAQRRGWFLRSAWPISALICLVGVACSSSHEQRKAAPPIPPDAATTIRELDFSRSDAIEQLNNLVRSGPSVVHTLAPLLNEKDTTRRRAAVYVAALATRAPAEVQILEKALHDSDPAIRVMAAGSIAGNGVVRGLSVLIRALEAAGYLPFSDPPQRIASFSAYALNLLTGQKFASSREGRAWLAKTRGHLHWSGHSYVVTP